MECQTDTTAVVGRGAEGGTLGECPTGTVELTLGECGQPDVVDVFAQGIPCPPIPRQFRPLTVRLHNI